MNRKILILSASAGAGHLRAAEAVAAALQELSPGDEVKNVDVLQLATPAFRKLYGEAYLDLVNKAPHLLGYIYDFFDRAPSPALKSDRLRLAIEKLNLGPLLGLLKSQPWDLVINTHFLPAEIIASLRKKGRLAVPQVTVTTDFETHRLWVNQPCEHYFTATEEGARNLAAWGIPIKDVSVTGIPIHPVFSRPKSKALCLKKQGLQGGRPVVLQLSGGFGVGPIEKIYRAVLAIPVPIEVVVVSGRNEAVKTALEKVPVPSRHRAKILGFTKEIDELMGAADLVLTKPGGLTTSETLARGAAMAVLNPIPGQESRNSDFLLENGAAVKVNGVATLPYKLAELLRQPRRLAQLKARSKALGRPRAAFAVARKALTFAK